MTCPQSICIQMVSNQHYFITGPGHEPDAIKATEGFDFGACLLATYDILDVILDYLPYSDLKNLSKLDSSWGSRIAEYLKKRMSPNVFCFSQHPAVNQQSSCTESIKPLCSIVFFNDVRIKLHCYVCIHRGTINSVSKKPVIQFIEENILSNEMCPVIALSCKQTEFSLPTGLYFNGVVFPCIPGVKVSVVQLSKENKDTIARIINDKIGDDNIVSCLLTFSLPIRKDIVFKKLHAVMKAIEERQPFNKCSLGGGMVTGVKTFNVTDPKKTKKTDDVLCVIFCTPKNEDIPFETYSLKITESMLTNNEVEEFLIDFKKSYKKRKHNVALRFSCMSLDENLGPVLQLFSKLFPEIEMSGFSCSGEIGWNNYKTEPTKEEDSTPPKKKSKKKHVPLVNYYTIIFVILSWGKEI